MLHKPLVLNNGKISQLPAGDTISGAELPSLSDKFDYHMAVLAAHDRIANVSYLDAGLKNQRVSSITYLSTLFPNSSITKTLFYLDVGTMNQRIEKIEYAGSVFSPDSLRKVFNYVLSGIKYRPSGYFYETF